MTAFTQQAEATTPPRSGAAVRALQEVVEEVTEAAMVEDELKQQELARSARAAAAELKESPSARFMAAPERSPDCPPPIAPPLLPLAQDIPGSTAVSTPMNVVSTSTSRLPTPQMLPRPQTSAPTSPPFEEVPARTTTSTTPRNNNYKSPRRVSWAQQQQQQQQQGSDADDAHYYDGPGLILSELRAVGSHDTFMV